MRPLRVLGAGVPMSKAIRWASGGGTKVKICSLKVGDRIQFITDSYCGRTFSVRVVMTILRGSGRGPFSIQISQSTSDW